MDLFGVLKVRETERGRRFRRLWRQYSGPPMGQECNYCFMAGGTGNLRGHLRGAQSFHLDMAVSVARGICFPYVFYSLLNSFSVIHALLEMHC